MSDTFRAASVNEAADPMPCDSKIAAISAIVKPSGNVMLMTYTSPRAILSITSNGVIARSKRYSPAFRCRPCPLTHNASNDLTVSLGDDQRFEALCDLAVRGHDGA